MACTIRNGLIQESILNVEMVLFVEYSVQVGSRFDRGMEERIRKREDLQS